MLDVSFVVMDQFNGSELIGKKAFLPEGHVESNDLTPLLLRSALIYKGNKAIEKSNGGLPVVVSDLATVLRALLI